MRSVLVAVVLAVGAAVVSAQGDLRVEPATLTCPSVLGEGAATGRTFCDVLVAREPTAGILVPLPPRRGDLTLTFDLHNRHLYSEDEIEANRGYHRYTAQVGVLTADNTLISRAIVQSEFRVVGDLFDRVLGGSGPSGLKAVAPTGFESVAVTIGGEFRNEESVSLMGERLWIVDAAGRTQQLDAVGRPIAVVSRVMLEYRPR